jgi:hypothetical protein
MPVTLVLMQVRVALQSGDLICAQLQFGNVTSEWQRSAHCVDHHVCCCYTDVFHWGSSRCVTCTTLATKCACLCRFEGQLAVGDVSADPNASLAVTFSGPGALLVDVVSLLPADNVARAAAAGAMNPWPFRADLLQMLKDLHPRLVTLSA